MDSGRPCWFRKGIPAHKAKTSGLNELFHPFTVLWANGEVVLQDDGTAVHAEGFVFRLVFQYIQNIVHQRSQTELALLRRVTPFPIPVGTADQVNDSFVHGFVSFAMFVVCSKNRFSIILQQILILSRRKIKIFFEKMVAFFCGFAIIEN